ncbi:class I SAM-dependent methyltransferase [Candidatus Pacearchaeota archaeon]|jgi:SAM-dependent methyltransferase|nr:class I SAM-dependent methyltransferase [Candidatus Pacearchaeota archaeon]
MILKNPSQEDIRYYIKAFDWMSNELKLEEWLELTQYQKEEMIFFCSCTTRLKEYPTVLNIASNFHGGLKGKKVLDIGSDMLFVSALLMEQTDLTIHKVFSSDYEHLTDILIWALRNNLEAEWTSFMSILKDYEAKMVVGLVEELPLQKEFFDVVFNISVLEHIPICYGVDKYEKHLKACWDLVAPGGIIIFTIDYLMNGELGYGDRAKNITNINVRHIQEMFLGSELIYGYVNELPGYINWDKNAWKKGSYFLFPNNGNVLGVLCFAFKKQNLLNRI